MIAPRSRAPTAQEVISLLRKCEATNDSAQRLFREFSKGESISRIVLGIDEMLSRSQKERSEVFAVIDREMGFEALDLSEYRSLTQSLDVFGVDRRLRGVRSPVAQTLVGMANRLALDFEAAYEAYSNAVMLIADGLADPRHGEVCSFVSRSRLAFLYSQSFYLAIESVPESATYWGAPTFSDSQAGPTMTLHVRRLGAHCAARIAMLLGKAEESRRIRKDALVECHRRLGRNSAELLIGIAAEALHRGDERRASRILSFADSKIDDRRIPLKGVIDHLRSAVVWRELGEERQSRESAKRALRLTNDPTVRAALEDRLEFMVEHARSAGSIALV